MKRWLEVLRNKLKPFIERFFLINDSPHKVAAGAALGVFFGISPGEGVATTLIIASILRFNRLAATAGVLATNAWTTFIVLPLAAAVGGFIFHESKQKLISDFKQTFKLGYKYFFTKAVFFDIALPLIVGYFIVSGLIAIAVYFTLLYFLKKNKVKFK
jgi:uncharacterized protein (DUF2062 family)